MLSWFVKIVFHEHRSNFFQNYRQKDIAFPLENQSVMMSWSYYMNFKDIYSINVIFIIVFAVHVCVCNIVVSSSLIIFMNKFDLHNQTVFLHVLLIVHRSVNRTCTFQQYTGYGYRTYLINLNFFWTKFTMYKNHSCLQ